MTDFKGGDQQQLRRLINQTREGKIKMSTPDTFSYMNQKLHGIIITM